MIASLVLLISSAHAACDKQIASVKGADSASVAEAYAALAACDKVTAEASFNDALGKATDTDSLTALAHVAIDKELWKPMWGALGKISSYEARDEVAQAVGASCSDKPKVVAFLQGAYFGLRDIEFQQWDDAFVACTDAGLTEWIEKQVKTPPKKHFDEKFVNLMAIYVKKKHEEALPALTLGAIAAAEAGPYDAMLFKMGEAVQPEMGAAMSPEAQAKLETALVEVASQVGQTLTGADGKAKAKAVASQLANNGSEAAAAKLLPVLYGSVADKGVYTYGAAAIEQGDCSGKKQAILHYAVVSEPGKRWSILKDLESPLRASKAKLKGCTVESPWPVIHSPEPVKGNGGVEDWIKALEKEWADKGFDVKTAKEKAITLP